MDASAKKCLFSDTSGPIQQTYALCRYLKLQHFLHALKLCLNVVFYFISGKGNYVVCRILFYQFDAHRIDPKLFFSSSKKECNRILSIRERHETLSDTSTIFSKLQQI
jgi:hypothetical protein